MLRPSKIAAPFISDFTRYSGRMIIYLINPFFIVQSVIFLSYGCTAEGVCFSNISTCSKILGMYFCKDIRTSDCQQIVIPF